MSFNSSLEAFDRPSFTLPPDETTGRTVVTFRLPPDGIAEGLKVLSDRGGVRELPRTDDFVRTSDAADGFAAAGGGVYPTLGIAVISQDDPDALAALDNADEVLHIEPERWFYALGDGLTAEYLRGFRDSAASLYERAAGGAEPVLPTAAATRPEIFLDDAASTWGLKATGVLSFSEQGQNIRVAVLDTGLDMKHPDFEGRTLSSHTFVPGQSVQDEHGHGTHCIGTACGRKDVSGRRYGVAGSVEIFAGKVLNNEGRGKSGDILLGMEWAINNACQVISLSLGNRLSTPSVAYNRIGQRALQSGCLIIAAAGNDRQLGFTVGQPANSLSIMAIGAVNKQLDLAGFSNTSGSSSGARVDLVGPGVGVYSSVPMDQRYDFFNGTSMATPHVAGIAALWSQRSGARGDALRELLVANAAALPSLSRLDVGSGLAKAPVG